MDPILIRNFAIALFIGALVGLEREKKDAPDAEHRIGGLRTFILFALAGATSAWLGQVLGTPWLFIATILVVAAQVLAGYVILLRTHGVSAGLTTEVAAVLVTLLGGLAILGQPEIAVALGIIVSAVLAFKQSLHQLAGRIGEDDLYAALKLLIASFIVLPLLPDRALDPFGALNPRTLWLLVILISGLCLVGDVAARLLGPDRGTSITGAVGGLVSSTAVTLSFARQSRGEEGRKREMDPRLAAALAAGILLAWTMMFLRVLVLSFVVAPSFARGLLAPMLLLGAVSAGGALLSLRAGHHQVAEQGVPLRNPFSLTAAIKVALFFAAILLLVEVVERYPPAAGIYAVAGLAGLTDTDAITLSLAQRVRDGSDVPAVRALLVAVLANTLVKGGLVATLGSRALRRQVLIPAALTLAVGAMLILGL